MKNNLSLNFVDKTSEKNPISSILHKSNHEDNDISANMPISGNTSYFMLNNDDPKKVSTPNVQPTDESCGMQKPASFHLELQIKESPPSDNSVEEV